jgi:hypothetical protein
MMQITKRLGIWIDHANAHLMELVSGPMKTTLIKAKFDSQEKRETIEKSEKGMHQKQNHEGLAYYKEIGKFILNYNDVLLFGPTEAKTELLNLLRADNRFDKIKIVTQPADKMTENQEYALVRDYFKKH